MQPRAASAVLMTTFCCCLLMAAFAIDSQPPVPSISEIEKISFAAANSTPDASSAYSDASIARNLFVAYGAEVKTITQYHDPLLTRSPQGQAIFKSVSPSVVAVVVGSLDKDGNFSSEGLGTGAIVDPRGFVVTNWHVINGYHGALVFLKPSGNPNSAKSEVLGAKVVYQDSTVDLALLKMIDPPTTLQALTVGDISQAQIAQDIHIIGHPHGNLWSYSTGVISQIRDAYTWSYKDGSNHVAKVLQLQTAINPGNSGGPVVDDSGHILGLVAMSEEGQNLDYAVAADVIKRFLGIGMQMTSRGTQAEASTLPQQLLWGKLSETISVSKSIFTDATLYELRKKDGTSIEAIAKFGDGSILTAWNPDIDGSFRNWSADFPDGRRFTATASSGFLTGISQVRMAASSFPR